MKELDGWVKIKKYTDDDGRPVCGGCLMLYDSGERYECDFEGVGIYPGQTCPIWHGESKSEGKPIHGEPTEPGYYWWLPVCYSGNANNPSHWNIIPWHPKDKQRKKSGTFVGPILPPISPREK